MSDTSGDLLAERLRVRVLAAPLDDSVPMSFGHLVQRQVCVVEIDAGGLTGVGESWVNYPAWAPEERVATLCEGVAPLLLGTDVSDPEQVQQSLGEQLLPIGRQWGAVGPMWQALSAVDLALWDLQGKVAGLPVHRLLTDRGRIAGGGGGRAALPAYASGVGPTDVEALCRTALAQGFTALKVRLGFGVDTDSATLAAARAAVGTDIALFADANQAWDLPTAALMCDQLADHGVAWLEEPLAGDDLEQLEKLGAETGMALATGENLYDLATFRRYMDSTAVRVIQPDLAKSGGLTVARGVAEHAARTGTSVAPHCYSSGIGVVAMLHLAAAYDCVEWLEYDLRDNPLRDRVLARPLTLLEGRLHVPDAPGLGADLHPEAVDAFQIRLEERTHHDL